METRLSCVLLLLVSSPCASSEEIWSSGICLTFIFSLSGVGNPTVKETLDWKDHPGLEGMEQIRAKVSGKESSDVQICMRGLLVLTGDLTTRKQQTVLGIVGLCTEGCNVGTQF